MSTSHHGAGGSYVIDDAGALKLQHRTKSREEAKAEESAAPAPAVQGESTSPATDKPADSKKSTTRSASE